MQAKLEFLNQVVYPVIQSQHWSLSNVNNEVVTDLADIAQSLDNIWNTPIGSDALRPDFGCNWIQYVDYPIDEAPVFIIRELMIATTRWEPRVIIKGITYHNEIEHIFFRTRYQLSEDIAGVLKGTEHQSTIRGGYGRNQ